MMPVFAPLPATWDLFCKVVDNFGDIGVSWRLARQLADECGLQIRLWVDDIAVAQRIAGAGHPQIVLQHWTPEADFSQPAAVVIETFGCGLPESYQQHMSASSCVWVNVDYLSAEAWVEGFHGQPSPQANGLIRHYFYPGFTEKTGGLLREAGLQTLQSEARWPQLGLTDAPETLTLSLFCYDHAPLAALVASLQASPQPVRVLVPQPLAALLAQVLGIPVPVCDDRIQRQQCEFVIIPFLSQTDYDRLLSLCDLNFVRGEDSWIRALWAGKPMIWLPYQQSEGTHLLKLEAFMGHYLQRATPALQSVIRKAMLAWANGSWQETHWQSLLAIWPQLCLHAAAFRQSQAEQTDLATNLVIFIEKCRTHRV